MKKLIIFDLDGTLLNTIADLGTSTNFALNHIGFPTHDIQSYKDRVGNGIAKMIERALPEGEKTEENINKVKKVFLVHYDHHKTDMTQPYDGIVELVNELQKKDIKMAVASNKYISAAKQIVSHFFPEIDFISVLGQRDGVATKPDPIIVYDILSKATQYNIKKTDVLYVGDSATDMQTAKNADVEACGVTWGFCSRSKIEEKAPQHIVDNTDKLLKIILK